MCCFTLERRRRQLAWPAERSWMLLHLHLISCTPQSQRGLLRVQHQEMWRSQRRLSLQVMVVKCLQQAQQGVVGTEPLGSKGLPSILPAAARRKSSGLEWDSRAHGHWLGGLGCATGASSRAGDSRDTRNTGQDSQPPAGGPLKQLQPLWMALGEGKAKPVGGEHWALQTRSTSRLNSIK